MRTKWSGRIVALLLFVISRPIPAHSQDPPKSADPISITIEGPVDAGLAPVAGQLTTLFYQCYPALLKRFDNPNKPAFRHVRVVFDPMLKIPAAASGDKIVVSVDWLRQHPEDIGMLTHELTHIVQAYTGRGPGWFTEGLADYTRLIYGPKEQPGWKLPDRLTDRQSYRDSYRVTGRFLQWLDKNYAGSVDKLHRIRQTGTLTNASFKEVTGIELEALWTECVQELSGS